MNQVVVRIPAPLRQFTSGANELELGGASVREVLAQLREHHSTLYRNLVDDRGDLRTFVNLFVGEKNIRALGGLDVRLEEGSVVSIIPAVAGGSSGTWARDQRIARLREAVPEVTPTQARRAQLEGAILLDVRESEEVAKGSPQDAIRLGRGFLELRIEDSVPDLERTLLVLCGGGVRSLFAAQSLLDLGYRHVSSVAGGFGDWKREGLPVEVPRTLDPKERERYGRHLTIPEVGEKGQIKLLESRVLLVGAGGLGSPVALYLAAAGVGTIGIVDDDTVDRSNLQRQILHRDRDVGTAKVESAERTLLDLNPAIRIEKHPVRLDRNNVEDLFANYQVIVDGTDNFPTRYLINDATTRLDLPNVHGSIFRFDGQVSVFWPGYENRRGPCYRCLFREPPPKSLAPSCAEAGVLGVLPGIVGTIQAVETIKILLEIGDPLVGRLLVFDALTGEFRELAVEPDPECQCFAEKNEASEYTDYESFCGTS